VNGKCKSGLTKIFFSATDSEWSKSY